MKPAAARSGWSNALSSGPRRSPKNRGARVHSKTTWPNRQSLERHAFGAKAQATKLLPTLVGPSTNTFSCMPPKPILEPAHGSRFCPGHVRRDSQYPLHTSVGTELSVLQPPPECLTRQLGSGSAQIRFVLPLALASGAAMPAQGRLSGSAAWRAMRLTHIALSCIVASSIFFRSWMLVNGFCRNPVNLSAANSGLIWFSL